MNSLIVAEHSTKEICHRITICRFTRDGFPKSNKRLGRRNLLFGGHTRGGQSGVFTGIANRSTEEVQIERPRAQAAVHIDAGVTPSSGPTKRIQVTITEIPGPRPRQTAEARREAESAASAAAAIPSTGARTLQRRIGNPVVTATFQA